MLDFLESLGVDLDGLDSGQSVRLHALLRPRAKPQSVCSALIEAELWPLVWMVGFHHCARSWERYR